MIDMRTFSIIFALVCGIAGLVGVGQFAWVEYRAWLLKQRERRY